MVIIVRAKIHYRPSLNDIHGKTLRSCWDSNPRPTDSQTFVPLSHLDLSAEKQKTNYLLKTSYISDIS